MGWRGMRTTLDEFWNGSKSDGNKFAEAFYKLIGGQSAQYDYDDKTYLEKGYGTNPIVYAVLSQMIQKTVAVPYTIKQVADKQSLQKLQQLQTATNGDYSAKQLHAKSVLETKAYSDKEKPFPLPKPNPNQSWGDILGLVKLFLRSTGNAYILKVAPTDGANAGVPTLIYVLPSHMMKIVLKKDVDLLSGESPIDHYMLREGDQFTTFSEDEVIHIKYPNPFYDFAGSHLYGMSPFRVLLRTLESSNEALNQNVKAMKNGGVFGFFHGKEQVLTDAQATQVKQKLMEMDKSPERLSKIAGVSVPLDFTRLSLNTDELKPFDFLDYDQKTICNVLNWSDKLLNNDNGSKYDNINADAKRVITSNILPDCILIQEALTEGFIQKFKGYENCVWDFDITELPEMQEDYAKMIEWMDKAPLTPNEKRTALKYETIADEGMDTVWIASGLKRIDEVGVTMSDVEKAYRDVHES